MMFLKCPLPCISLVHWSGTYLQLVRKYLTKRQAANAPTTELNVLLRYRDKKATFHIGAKMQLNLPYPWPYDDARSTHNSHIIIQMTCKFKRIGKRKIQIVWKC